jgi:hypothetical protein
VIYASSHGSYSRKNKEKIQVETFSQTQQTDVLGMDCISNNQGHTDDVTNLDTIILGAVALTSIEVAAFVV